MIFILIVHVSVRKSRLLVATAKADGFTIVTNAENIRKYDVLSIW